MTDNDDENLLDSIKETNDKARDIFNKIKKYDTDGKLIRLVEMLIDLKCEYNMSCLIATLDKRYKQSYKILKWYADESNSGELNRFAKEFIDRNENPYKI